MESDVTLAFDGIKLAKAHKQKTKMEKENDKSKMSKMEQEIKSLKKHMGGLVRTILDLKSEVEVLKKKDEETKKR